MSKKTTGALVPLLLVSAALSACGSGTAATEDQESASAPLPVAVVAPQVADMAATYAITASLVAEEEATIPARIAGDIVAIFVEEGDRVKRGQVLARLDGERSRLTMRQAKADFERLGRERERLGKLHEKGLVSSASRDDVAAALEASKAAYERARLDVEYTAIRATIDGVVSNRAVKIGAALAEGEEAFVVTNTADLIAYLDIPQNELFKFTVGQEAALGVDSQPGVRFQAYVERISPTIDKNTGTFRATLSVDNAGGSLAPGMFADFVIVWDTYSNAVVIPESAAIREDNETIVFVVENGEAVRRRVEPGLESGGLLQIVDGLSLDDSIVLTGQARLRDGSRVLARSAAADRSVTG